MLTVTPAAWSTFIAAAPRLAEARPPSALTAALQRVGTARRAVPVAAFQNYI